MTARWIALVLLFSAVPSPVAAQDQKDEKQEQGRKEGDPTLRKAGDIATQPVRDVGISKTKIPPVLTEAVKNPYAPPGGRKCKALLADLQELNDALGPDFGASREENEDKAGKIAEAAGQTLVNSLIPFRGLVREISGAAPAERRLQAAIGAGLARRGYLRGLATARHCRIPAVPEKDVRPNAPESSDSDRKQSE